MRRKSLPPRRPGADPPPSRRPGEVRFVRLTRRNFAQLHPLTLSLMRRHGDSHLTWKALRHYATLEAEETEQPGNLILAALDEHGHCIGAVAALAWGYRLSLVVTSRNARGRGLAGKLLRLAIRALGRYYAEVAGDNLPSLRVFFACGLRAYDAFTRPSGKVVLRLRTLDPPPDPGGKVPEPVAGPPNLESPLPPEGGKPQDA